MLLLLVYRTGFGKTQEGASEAVSGVRWAFPRAHIFLNFLFWALLHSHCDNQVEFNSCQKEYKESLALQAIQ